MRNGLHDYDLGFRNGVNYLVLGLYYIQSDDKNTQEQRAQVSEGGFYTRLGKQKQRGRRMKCLG